MCNILFFLYLQCNTVPTQLMSYLDEQAIMEVFQSGFSTEY